MNHNLSNKLNFKFNSQGNDAIFPTNIGTNLRLYFNRFKAQFSAAEGFYYALTRKGTVFLDPPE